MKADPTLAKRDRAGAHPARLRVAVFTHDTFGLGHVRRSLHIIRALCARQPQASVLLITGSPALHVFRDLPPHVDLLKIPTLVRHSAAGETPAHLNLPLPEVTSIRRQVICSALEAFRPDVFLVDNFPLGSRKELLPALESLHRIGVPAVLGLRDIVDRPEVVRDDWNRNGIHQVLDRLFCRILVYGLPEILEASRAYGLDKAVARKLHYCGYVTSLAAPQRTPEEVRRELGLPSPIVLATVGGGGDGFPLLSTFLEATTEMPEFSTVAITGPLMSAADRARIHTLARARPNNKVIEFVQDLPSYLAAADLIVAMGGYNTVAELIGSRRRALIMPRNWRYGEHARGTSAGMEWEQLLRAEAMERLGLVHTIRPDDLTPATLARRIHEVLQAPHQPPDLGLLGGGVNQVVEHLLEVAGRGVSHAHS